MIIKAYAKINLTLDIVGILPNGFHGLRSIMAPVSLCDHITIEKSNTLQFDCNIKSLCSDDNLCIRAANAFFQESGISERVSIYLQKNIPFPAGLGGGSADAAAILKGLNSLFGNPLTQQQLFNLGAKLGSDVPICMHGSVALCEGRGEILTPLSGVPKLNIVIAIGGERLSTPLVFKAYDNANLPVQNDTDNFITALGQSDITALINACGNAFEPVVDKLCPETTQIRNQLLTLGALNARLSGSGPSVYGIFQTESDAVNAVTQLQNMGYSAYNCKIM